MPRSRTAGALSIFRVPERHYRGAVLVVAVILLGAAMAVLALALRRASTSPSPSALLGPARAATAAAAALDEAVTDFRAAVDDRTDR